jgi:hypothetical protein
MTKSNLAKVFDSFHFGPGFRVRRGAAHDEPLPAIYEVAIWDSLISPATAQLENS